MVNSEPRVFTIPWGFFRSASRAMVHANPIVTHSIRNRPLPWFFAIAYAVSWTLWCPAVAASFGWIGPVPSCHLHLAGGLGPMVAATMATFVAEGRPGLARLSKR